MYDKALELNIVKEVADKFSNKQLKDTLLINMVNAIVTEGLPYDEHSKVDIKLTRGGDKTVIQGRITR